MPTQPLGSLVAVSQSASNDEEYFDQADIVGTTQHKFTTPSVKGSTTKRQNFKGQINVGSVPPFGKGLLLLQIILMLKRALQVRQKVILITLKILRGTLLNQLFSRQQWQTKPYRWQMLMGILL